MEWLRWWVFVARGDELTTLSLQGGRSTCLPSKLVCSQSAVSSRRLGCRSALKVWATQAPRQARHAEDYIVVNFIGML